MVSPHNPEWDMEKMRFYFPFEWTGDTFEERIGEPEAFDAAFGKLVMNHMRLDRAVDRTLHRIAGTMPQGSEDGSAGPSFGRRMDLLTLLVSEPQDTVPFNTAPTLAEEVFGELRHNPPVPG
jgi:hypothetical protein